MPCVFCDISIDRVTHSSSECFAIYDAFPVTEGHTLIISKSHVKSPLELSDKEIAAMFELTKQLAHTLTLNDSSINGFNIGFNVGAVAGQTIWHTHLHLIPRRIGDVEIPTGGIRNIIPGKGNYID